MRYEGKLYRPPSEAHSFILQATIGCSWNKCVYCDMYREKSYRVRSLDESLEDIDMAAREHGPEVHKMFVADGDALILDMDHWEPILERARARFPNLRQVSCYAMASNVLEKSEQDLLRLKELGLTLLYIGPESGDDETLRRIAKGGNFDDHAEAARKLRASGMRQSVIFLLGAGGVARSAEHAMGSGRLVTAMDPDFLSALTLTVVPGTPMARMEEKGLFELPDVLGLLGELRTIVAEAQPTRSIFRTNHASNYLPLSGRLPRDRERLVEVLDDALSGKIPLRPEFYRGL